MYGSGRCVLGLAAHAHRLDYGLFLALFEWLSASSLFPVAGSVLIYGLILLSILSPRVRNNFAAMEEQRKNGVQ